VDKIKQAVKRHGQYSVQYRGESTLFKKIKLSSSLCSRLLEIRGYRDVTRKTILSTLSLHEYDWTKAFPRFIRYIKPTVL